MKYVYDTNVFIDYLSNDEMIADRFSEYFLNSHQIFISPIVRIELLSFPDLSEEEIRAIEDLLAQFPSIPLSREIEDLTIDLKRRHKIKIPDAIIAATALNLQACLVTRNIDDFKNIPELILENPFIQ